MRSRSAIRSVPHLALAVAALAQAGVGEAQSQHATRDFQSSRVAGLHSRRPSASPVPFTSLALAALSPARSAPAARSLKMPLRFEVNQGQSDASTRFLLRGAPYGLAFQKNEAVFAFKEKKLKSSAVRQRAVRMKLLNATGSGKLTGEEPFTGKSHYYIGSDPRNWRSNIPNFGRLRYPSVYRGVDLAFYGNSQQLEYDFIVQPKADLRHIRMQWTGADKVTLNASGDLTVKAGGQTLHWHRPVAYQPVQGQRVPVSARYALRSDGSVGFRVARYDPRKPLVIDPVLVFSTYLGGSGYDEGKRVAIDGAGNILVCGYTESADFPLTTAAVGARGAGDAFVAKFNPAGTQLLSSTVIGGSGSDLATRIALGPNGTVVVAGTTGSTNFPTTQGAAQTAYAGGSDAFAAVLNASGTLRSATYLGGALEEELNGLAVDGEGNAYVTGRTYSSDFPHTVGQYNTSGFLDGFVTRLSPDCSLLASRILPGENHDIVTGVALDSGNNVWITGWTRSSEFPVTAGAYQTTLTPSIDQWPTQDGFLTQLDPTLTNINYSAFVGGNGADNGVFLSINASGRMVLFMGTTSTDFVTTPGAYSIGNSGRIICFQLNDPQNPVLQLVYISTGNVDSPEDMALAAAGEVYLAGWSNGGIVTKDGVDPRTVNGSGTDGIVSVLNNTGTDLLFATQLGGSGTDYTWGVATDGQGTVYATGATRVEPSWKPRQTPITTTAGAYDTTFSGISDGYLVKISLAPAAVAGLAASAPSSSQINLTWSNQTVNQQCITIERSTGGSAYSVMATLPGTATSYSSTGLSARTTYSYRVTAQNQFGTSSPATTSATTKR